MRPVSSRGCLAMRVSCCSPPRQGPKKWSRICAALAESTSIRLNRIEVEGGGGVGAVVGHEYAHLARLVRADIDDWRPSARGGRPTKSISDDGSPSTLSDEFARS